MPCMHQALKETRWTNSDLLVEQSHCRLPTVHLCLTLFPTPGKPPSPSTTTATSCAGLKAKSKCRRRPSPTYTPDPHC